MEKTLRHYPKLLETLVTKGPFTRLAWGIATDNRLNHHPEPPPGQQAQAWPGRRRGPGTSELFVRVERQNLLGLPEVHAFLFTIRTYFYALASLDAAEQAALLRAVESMSPAALQYKGLTGQVARLREMLEKA
jgi:dimethylamine monooxygenase subunit A